MHTQLGLSAYSNVAQFKNHVTLGAWERVEDAVRTFDANLTLCGYLSIEAKTKLRYIEAIRLPEFLELADKM